MSTFFDPDKFNSYSAVEVVKRLTTGSKEEQMGHACALAAQAAQIGTTPELMLMRFVNPHHKDTLGYFPAGTQIDGASAVFAMAGVPTKASNQLERLQLAANGDMFTTTGLKVLLPALIENLTREVSNEVLLEKVSDLVASTRNVTGTELITEIIYDKASGDAYDSFRIPEGANIPVRKLKVSNQGVKFFKSGHGIEYTYETARRIRPEMLLTMVNRQRFERTQAEARAAVEVLIDGDGVNPAATAESLTTYDGKATGRLRDRFEGFIKWLMAAAKAGRPMDTLVVNYDTWFEMAAMFPIQNTQNVPAQGAGALGPSFGATFRLQNGLNLPFNIVLSSQMPDNAVLGYKKNETLEQLIESGSDITETERSIRSQSIVIVSTINSGFLMHYHESRRLLNWTN
jgi:hypothetical protein